jgi:hypothetical protein
MSLLIAGLFLILGLMFIFQFKWVGMFNDERKKKFARKCGIIILVSSILLFAIQIFGWGK